MYIEKLEKLRRQLNRLQNENRSNLDYKDDLDSFFVECWSLKDWIKNDPKVINKIHDITSVLERYISSDINLQICADLANRNKHYLLTQKRVDAKIAHSEMNITCEENINFLDRVREEACDELYQNGILVKKIIHKEEPKVEATYNIKESDEVIKQKYIIEDKNGNSYDALRVAKDSLKSWNVLVNTLSI